MEWGGAPRETVVRCAGTANGDPDIPLLGCSPTICRGKSWTPQQHAAPIGPVLPEAKAWPNTYEDPRCQETNYPWERILCFFPPCRSWCSHPLATCSDLVSLGW